jgi:hypothetical protein
VTRALPWLLVAWLAGTSSAIAGLPFRLDALHWGMSQADAAAQLPGLAPLTAGRIGVATHQDSLEMRDYRWKLCRLHVSAYFVDGQLNALSVDQGYPVYDDGCARSIREELTDVFGEGRARPDSAVGNQKVMGREWCAPDTIAGYTDMGFLGVESDLLRRGGPPVIDPSKPIQCP